MAEIAETTDIRALIVDTGRLLLEKGLVARTWGNISCRNSETTFAISPSGLGYENMTSEDVPIYDYVNDTYEGSRKPSSEKKIHSAAYKIYPDVNFVLHTHQDYATVVGLVGTDNLKMTEEESKILGPIVVAEYGLPGTDTLRKNVEAAYAKGSKVVLMIHHGVVILGDDCEDAIKKAEILEEICRRTISEALPDALSGVDEVAARRSISEDDSNAENGGSDKNAEDLIADIKNAVIVSDSNILFCADNGGLPAQIDDIVQMTGSKIKAVSKNKAAVARALKKKSVVLVKGVGCVISEADADDAKALEMLVKKAALASRYTSKYKVTARLSFLDCLIMRAVYTMKYSKQKKG